MGEWENNAYGFVGKKDWLDVGFNVTRPNDPIDGLFGDERTDNIMAYWQTIAAEYQIPMMAQFHGFDTEAQTTFRVPVDTHNIEKGLIKVKINQSERMRALTRSGVRNDQMYNYVLDDGIRLADQVVTRTKVAKNELMATGKVTIKENNLDLTVDYGVPEAQTALAINLDADQDVPAQIQSVVDAAKANGVTLTGMMTAQKNITKLRGNAAIQKAVNGNIGAGALVRGTALSAYLEEEFGLSRVITNDMTYGASANIGTDGRPVISAKRYYPDNKITFFAANPAGRLGVGLWGDPPEVDTGAFHSVQGSGVSPYVYIMQWAETDPAVIWTKASALFIPVLYNPSSLFIASVTTEQTLKDLTVTSAAGTDSGTTKLTVSPNKASGNLYKVKTGMSASPVIYGQNVQTWTAWDGTADVTAATGQKVTVVECGSDYKAVGAGSATVTAKA